MTSDAHILVNRRGAEGALRRVGDVALDSIVQNKPNFRCLWAKNEVRARKQTQLAAYWIERRAGLSSLAPNKANFAVFGPIMGIERKSKANQTQFPGQTYGHLARSGGAD